MRINQNQIRPNALLAGYQVLCANCNFAKMKYGVCVHKIPNGQRKAYRKEFLIQKQEDRLNIKKSTEVLTNKDESREE